MSRFERQKPRKMYLQVLAMGAVLMAALAAAKVEPISAGAQEHGDADRERGERKVEKRTVAELTAELRRKVNGKAAVSTTCDIGGQQVEVEENTEVLETSECRVRFRTRKSSGAGESHRQTEFTLSVDLADLTFPSTVEQQSFSRCKPVQGRVLKLMSRTQPGKSVRSSRRAEGFTGSDTSQSERSRHDLSLFFADERFARQAGQILDRAIQKCGGKEWPDEDDLP